MRMETAAILLVAAVVGNCKPARGSVMASSVVRVGVVCCVV